MTSWSATLGRILKKSPRLHALARRCLSRIRGHAPFPGSADYWDWRYRAGGNSGAGSYGRLAEWKAEVINTFVREKKIQHVVEHGFGDGNQLLLASYPNYLGLDISRTAVALCKKKFAMDPSKQFLHASEYAGEKGELALSLDVIFHLVEDDVFQEYMERLFRSAENWVIIYSSNRDGATDAPHVRHRDFLAYVRAFEPSFQLVEYIPNKFPFDLQDPDNTSFADFYIFASDRKVIRKPSAADAQNATDQ